MNELTIEKLINHHRNAEDYERMLHAANEGEEHKHFADFHRDAAKLLEELHNKHWSECRQIALYDDENRKLKRLLKLALEELTVPCDFCAYRHCPPSPERIGCTWRHAAEARTLIGGDAL